MKHEFRAFDQNLGLYLPGFMQYYFIASLNSENYIVEQFTGLHDATTWVELTESERDEWCRIGHMPSEWKGCKIFEGDLVKEDCPRGRVYRVFAVPGGFAVRTIQDEIEGNLFFEPLAGEQMRLYIESLCRVIGNVNQNKELMEVKK